MMGARCVAFRASGRRYLEVITPDLAQVRTPRARGQWPPGRESAPCSTQLNPAATGQHQSAADDHQQHKRERETRNSEIHGSATLSTATWHRCQISQNRADLQASSGVCSSRCTPDRGRSDHRRTDRAHPGTVPARVDRALRGRRLVPTARAPCPARRGPARYPGTGGNSRFRCLVARSCAARFRQRDSSWLSLVTRHANACNSCHSGRSSRVLLRTRRVLTCSGTTQGSRHAWSAAGPPHVERTKVKNPTSPSAASSMSITRAGSKMPSVALAGSSGK
jgi:hypothetical protein